MQRNSLKMKARIHILICFAISCMLFSCTTQPARFATPIPGDQTFFELNCCDIQNISVPDDNRIERLNLTNCKLTRIPSGIRRCKQLNALNLTGNQIRHIPRWIMELDSLEEINLNSNQLKLTRSDIRRLSKVKQILICNNAIEKLPRNIGRMRCESLNLAKNKLHSLPKSFA